MQSEGGGNNRQDPADFPPLVSNNTKWSGEEWSVTSRGTHGTKTLYHTGRFTASATKATTKPEQKNHFHLAHQCLFGTTDLARQTGYLASPAKQRDNFSMRFKSGTNSGYGTKTKYVPDTLQVT